MRPLDADRELARGPFPDAAFRGLTDAELDHAIDAWYVQKDDEKSSSHDHQ